MKKYRFEILFVIVLVFISLTAQNVFCDSFTTKLHPEGKDVQKYEITDYDTDHFRIVCDTSDEKILEFVASTAEEAFSYLEKKFSYTMNHKIILVVDTKLDYYYGYTDILERRIYVSLGAPKEIEGYGRNYIKSLIFHEMTHYFVSHKIEKVPHGLGRSIGWVIIPMWFHEGICEYFSTDWDSFSDILSRNAFLNLNVSMDSMLTFYFADTFGRRMGYNHGFSFVKFLSETYGEEILMEILKEVKKLNPRFRHILQKTTKECCTSLFKKWKESQIEKYKLSIAGRKNAGTLGTVLETGNKINVNPVFSKNGIYYAAADNSDFFQFSIYHRDMKTSEKRRIIKNVHPEFDVNKDGNLIAYSKRNIFKEGNVMSDIYLFDMETGKSRKLTRNMHGNSPSFSSDNKKIVFNSAKGCTQNIWIMDIDGKNKKPLTSFKIGEITYSPEFAENDSKIYFSLRTSDGDGNIGILSGENFSDINFIHSKGNVLLRPEYATENNSLYLISGNGNFFDLCVRDEKNRIKRITDLSSGIIDYAVNSQGDKLILSEIYGRESRLVSVDINRLKVEEIITPEEVTPKTHEYSNYKITLKRSKYDGIPEFRYLVPWVDSAGGNAMFGFKTKFSDPLKDNQVELISLYGGKGYKIRTMSFIMKGMNPMFGAHLYDVADEFRPGQNRTLKGGDLFLSYRINPHASITGSAYRRTITSNAISPVYALRNPATGDIDAKDAGVSTNFTYYKALRTVDQDINPINVSSISLNHSRTSNSMHSFYDYKLARIQFGRSLIINDRNDQIALTFLYGHASGDYEFQFGGIGELRGYRSSPLVGRRITSTSLEYKFSKMKFKFINQFLSLTSIYPTVFYDRGDAFYRRSPQYKSSSGIEFASRILLFNKLSLAAVYGAAVRSDDKGSEVYGQLVVEF